MFIAEKLLMITSFWHEIDTWLSKKEVK